MNCKYWLDTPKNDFRARLEGMAKNECVPHLSRNYLSDKFAKELRRARETKPCPERKCGEVPTSCTQVLKSNLPCSNPPSTTCNKPREQTICRRQTDESSARDTCAVSASARAKTVQPYGIMDCESPIMDRAKRDIEISRSCRNGDTSDTSFNLKNRNLQELEDKVDHLNTQAQQLLKQLKREQVEREKMAELYDEALDEVKRLRERERPPNPDLESRVRRLECERDEAIARSRTTQVDNEELRTKLDKIGEENCRERQRLVDKITSMEHRMHASEADHDDLVRRHNRSLETMTKLESQNEEQRAKISALEDQKVEHLKQIENLSLFVKDLEQTSKQLHERIDEKRYELHQTREKVTELEDLLVKLDQHLLQEKDRFIQIQNDAYQAQVKNQELRTELRNSMKKRSKCQN